MTADTVPAPDVQPRAKIFISYSRKDMAFADRLEAALKVRGFEPLIDRTEIYAFEDWWRRIEALIASTDTVVFVLSPDAVASKAALQEVMTAASLNKRFAPIVCRRVKDSAIPEPLRRLNFIFFDEPANFDTNADVLADALQTDIIWIRQHTEYGEAERRWSTSGCPVGLLLHPPTLEVAEHWLAARPRNAPEPTAAVRTFIAESRKRVLAVQRRQRLTRASVYALLLGVIAGLIGWINQQYIMDQWRWYTVERPFVAANVWPHVLNDRTEAALNPGDRLRECASPPGSDFCPEMIVVPAGSFMMGSEPATFDDLAGSEFPRHRVTIAKPFAVSKFQVTFHEWDTCAAYGGCPQGISAAQGERGQQPVINITWENAHRYVAWLSRITGKTYRLLSEAEFEYVARAGTETKYPWGDDIRSNGTPMANCRGCGGQWDGRATAPVGSFPPNGFGLYDMVGNVHQWVEDCAHRNYVHAPTDGTAWIDGGNCKNRVVRGGSWFNSPDSVRSASRESGAIDFASPNLGFRVGRTLPP